MGLAFLVSCLGLFGLAFFSSERCKKEIGFWKVKESDIRQIMWLFTADLTKLILMWL